MNKIKLNIAALIRWEQLADRPFSSFNDGDEEDVLRLLYCASTDAMRDLHTFETFRTALESQPRHLRDLARALARANAFVAQFQRIAQSQTSDESEGGERIGTIAARLIVRAHIDARYVMEEMPLADIALYADALAEQFKQEEESRRLWTWLGMRPHLAKDAVRTPQDLYRFPWEEVRRVDVAAERAKIEAKQDEFKKQLAAAEWNVYKR